MKHLNAIQITVVVAGGIPAIQFVRDYDWLDGPAKTFVLTVMAAVWLVVVIWNINANFVALDKED